MGTHNHSNKIKQMIKFLVLFATFQIVSAQNLYERLPESEWVNDPSYPSTFYEFLKVFDSFMGGLSGYTYVPESRLCVRFLADK